MVKLALSTAALLVALSTSALAASQVWNVTEEGDSGLKNGQGQWFVTIDGDNKLSGNANLLFDNGNPLTYALDGTKSGDEYTVNMSKRTDGKNGCVWSGHIPAGSDMKSHGLIGRAVCDGKVGFTIRAGF